MKATTVENKVEATMAEKVKEPIQQAFRTAAKKVDELAADTKEAAGKLETKVMKATKDMRAKGQEIAKDPRGFMEGVVSDGKKRAMKVSGELSKEASRVADVVTRRVSNGLEKAVEKTLHRFNVPTHAELQKLTSKVDTLNSKIDSMKRTKAPAKKAARRPAAKKTSRSRSTRSSR
jgi:uncharacterized protein Yka (UPF0111/DUF47 family)